MMSHDIAQNKTSYIGITKASHTAILLSSMAARKESIDFSVKPFSSLLCCQDREQQIVTNYLSNIRTKG